MKDQRVPPELVLSHPRKQNFAVLSIIREGKPPDPPDVSALGDATASDLQ